MKNAKRKVYSHIINIVIIILVVVCFLCSMMAVRKYAREDCVNRIEEVTVQISRMFNHAMDERRDKLTIFADILAANSENPGDLLQKYMESFCRTQYFSAVCVHRADGSMESYGEHPHDEVNITDFELEVSRLPYVSEVFSYGNMPENKLIYQAVPIVRGGKTIAILYGYMFLDIMPDFIVSGAYDGKCQFYVVDGDTGEFLMDEYHGTLGNLYVESLSAVQTKSGYDIDEMREAVKKGESGYFVFRSQQNEGWYHTYYMPLGINNWSMQLTIDEETAFTTYMDISRAVLILMIAVIFLTVSHIILLMMQNANANRRDKTRLHKSDYINRVQRALINAHSNSDFVDRALGIVAEEMKAETVLLLSFSDKKVTNAQYWPSKDKAQAMDMMGRDIREDFPMLFDRISDNDSVIYDKNSPEMEISPSAKEVFSALDVTNMILVPITDSSSVLKGAIAAVNVESPKSAEMLECVTYDFFMALANLENHNIIKKMGEIDYLTGIKNRNSYESEIAKYVAMDKENLWCVFVDVNGLHEVNNTKGHKAGDKMLCVVADAIKRVFGQQHTYRLGGDEFVAFDTESSEDELLRKKKRIITELATKGYYVSIGFRGAQKAENDVFDVEQIVSEAESAMYDDKWEYYRSNDIPLGRGHFSNK